VARGGRIIYAGKAQNRLGGNVAEAAARVIDIEVRGKGFTRTASRARSIAKGETERLEGGGMSVETLHFKKGRPSPALKRT